MGDVSKTMMVVCCAAAFGAGLLGGCARDDVEDGKDRAVDTPVSSPQSRTPRPTPTPDEETDPDVPVKEDTDSDGSDIPTYRIRVAPIAPLYTSGVANRSDPGEPIVNQPPTVPQPETVTVDTGSSVDSGSASTPSASDGHPSLGGDDTSGGQLGDDNTDNTELVDAIAAHNTASQKLTQAQDQLATALAGLAQYPAPSADDSEKAQAVLDAKNALDTLLDHRYEWGNLDEAERAVVIEHTLAAYINDYRSKAGLPRLLSETSGGTPHSTSETSVTRAESIEDIARDVFTLIDTELMLDTSISTMSVNATLTDEAADVRVTTYTGASAGAGWEHTPIESSPAYEGAILTPDTSYVEPVQDGEVSLPSPTTKQTEAQQQLSDTEAAHGMSAEQAQDVIQAQERHDAALHAVDAAQTTVDAAQAAVNDTQAALDRLQGGV